MSQDVELKPLVLNPDEGRAYSMGRMSAIFKADLAETNSTLSVSEWWMEPNTEGPLFTNTRKPMSFMLLKATWRSTWKAKTGLRLRRVHIYTFPVEKRARSQYAA